ncbi:FadR/GntR family transcriptional regulator [Marinomonas spartinae]|uniref:FadR/GntR family transcriptional regulator n=1 Tax=Marinomonas spartinae TaxID=1792290 RepID=UPI0018F1E8EB|nr:FadR/GntR family transcriptional regulator [Marinomonas spartinae]MBJ7555861.1 FadR family transcriptional regulator [Marinomonas spartinae]
MNSEGKLVNRFQIERVGKSDSLASNVAKQLEQQIAAGAIAVGDKLPTENELCDLFGVSRTVIREAITQLKSLGLVETKRGVGTSVLRTQAAETLFAYQIDPTAIDDILYILEMRISVETTACELAALRRTEEEVALLEAHFQAFDEALSRGELARKEDYEFHLAICTATRNPFLKQFYEQFNKNVIPRANLVNSDLKQVATDNYLQRVRSEHLEILNCIKNKDAEGAKQAMHNHLYRAYHLYQRYQDNNKFD